MPRKDIGAGAERERSDAQILRAVEIEQALAALEVRVTAIERLLAAIPIRPALFPLRGVFLDVPGPGGARLAAAENVSLKHCEWQTIYEGETPQRVKITGGNGGPGKIEIEVDGKRIDDLRSPNTTFVEGKKIRVHFKQDAPPPGEPEPLLGGFTGATVERGVGPGALMGTIHLELRPCEWHTVFGLSAKACIRVVNNGGINPQPLEVEVDGARKDDLGVGNAAQHEGKTVRVHGKGGDTALVSIEPCR